MRVIYRREKSRSNAFIVPELTLCWGKSKYGYFPQWEENVDETVISYSKRK
jgi:hypothetical protein